MSVDQEMVDFLAGVVGVVEANSFEHLTLWQDNQRQPKPMAWEENRSGGPLVTVGELAGMPVCIALRVERVGGHSLLFVDATSQVVDHRLIDKWLLDNLPPTARHAPGGYINRVDAMNFPNVFPRVENVKGDEK